jgi:hypothetical protein
MMRSTPRGIRILLAAAVLLGLVPARAGGQGFPVLRGDPIDPASGRARMILPGVPLMVPRGGNRFDTDPSFEGDVDLVVRAGSPTVETAIPEPAAPPVVAVAGGRRVLGGTAIPFTVVASDGDPTTAVGHPLLGPEMDGIPVIVTVFADLDGDGFIGPTNADADGVLDNARELQEAYFPVGRQVAFFTNGVARGNVAVRKGAPASAGGLSVVLTAVAFVGPSRPLFFFGAVPEGPGVATLLPFFPDTIPDHVVPGRGGWGPASPDTRLDFVLRPAFEPPVDDAVVGTPFALPTDGSSPTIDRAIVYSGAFSRLRFVRPSSPAAFSLDDEVPLARGVNGSLWEELGAVDLPDDGPGDERSVHLVPVDALDNITDPPSDLTVTLVAGPGVLIVAPDTDNDPTTETVFVPTAAGIDVVLDDAGQAEDASGNSRLTVVSGGYPTAALDVHFTLPTYPVPPSPLADVVVARPVVSPDTVTADGDWTLTVSAAVATACDIDQVNLELDAGEEFRKVGHLRDDGEDGDPVAGDGSFTEQVRICVPHAGTLQLRVVARTRRCGTVTGATVDVPVVAR